MAYDQQAEDRHECNDYECHPERPQIRPVAPARKVNALTDWYTVFEHVGIGPYAPPR